MPAASETKAMQMLKAQHKSKGLMTAMESFESDQAAMSLARAKMEKMEKKANAKYVRTGFLLPLSAR